MVRDNLVRGIFAFCFFTMFSITVVASEQNILTGRSSQYREICKKAFHDDYIFQNFRSIEPYFNDEKAMSLFPEDALFVVFTDNIKFAKSMISHRRENDLVVNPQHTSRYIRINHYKMRDENYYPKVRLPRAVKKCMAS